MQAWLNIVSDSSPSQGNSCQRTWPPVDEYIICTNSKSTLIHRLCPASILLRKSLVDECTFCITFSYKDEAYTESALMYR